MADWKEYQNTFQQFAEKVYEEQREAAEKFPGGERLLGALMEEVGELAEALLHIKERDGSPERVYEEGVQVASTVYRLLTEGEPDYGYGGTKCHYAGCKQPTIGGPCRLCYD